MSRKEVEGNLVDVLDGRIYPARLIVVDARVYGIREISSAPDSYILPGLIDAHIHIESSTLCPSRFAEAAVAHGTTAVISDPHEIANVMGMEGVMYMVEEARHTPVRLFFTAPSCVPAMPNQMHGGRLGREEVRELLRKDCFVALGEVMNYRSVLANDPETMGKLEMARSEGKPVDGHAPGLTGGDLDRYISAGISTDHECTTNEEALEKHRKGMRIMIRQGSASKNMESLAQFAMSNKCFLVSDDLDALDLTKGHVNRLLANAVAFGMDPLHAIRAVTLWPAEHYNLPCGRLRENGMADFVVVNDLDEFRVLETWIGGNMVAKDGKALFSAKPNPLKPSILHPNLRAQDLMIKHIGLVARVEYIQALPDQIMGGIGTVVLEVRSGTVLPDVSRDVLLLAVANRYVKAPASLEFIRGFGLKSGAIASSVAHDAHNIIGVGTSSQTLANAMNSAASQGGGYYAFDGERSCALPLPVAGLMSDLPCSEVSGMQARIDAFVRNMGCQLPAPFMTLSFQDPEFRKMIMGNSGRD
ncbi:MAG: adenine deaminase [Methanomassiliicoccales archaeon]|nr:adenine deaminase [Methanomassiliicoccales archaeon]